MEASRNSGSATTVYLTLSMLPTALAAIALFGKAGGDVNVLAERLVTHLRLHGTTADVVRETFGTTAENALAATLAVVVGFFFWGIGIGQIYRDLYCRAWKVETAQVSDQVLFTVWYFVTCILLGLQFTATTELRERSVALLVPVWLLAALVFWLWTPRFLLHRRVPVRDLLPGALLGAVVLGGTIASAPLWMGSTLNTNAKAFGPFGVMLAFLGFLLVTVTISMACAVFSPVWLEFREAERSRPA